MRMIELAQDEWAGMNWLTAARAYAKDRGLRDPLLSFKMQQHGALARGIEWKFSIEQWWDFWKDSYERRSGGGDGLCMARHGDVGPYAPWNVYMTTNRQNVRDFYANQRTQRFKKEIHGRRAESAAKPKKLKGKEAIQALIDDYLSGRIPRSTPEEVERRLLEATQKESETRRARRDAKNACKVPQQLRH
jgi:hypothetical protein